MEIKINASQTGFSALLSNKKKYCIPEFQRPYSWEEEECETLWNDLKDHDYETDEKQQYFLGSIVIVKNTNEADMYDVIDGQQRLITVSLLLRAFLMKNKQNSRLDDCLQIKAEWEDESTPIFGPPRLESRVNGSKENELLAKILSLEEKDLHEKIRKNSDHDESDLYYKNFLFFYNVTKELDIGEFKTMVEHVLYDVVILPIECQDEDQALTIFQTINDRGRSLSDADILKAKLYRNADEKGEKEDFIKLWGELISYVFDFAERYDRESHDVLTNLFRDYMYILRARNNDTTKTVNLRDFYEGKALNTNKKRKKEEKYHINHKDYKDVIEDLIEVIKAKKCIAEAEGKLALWLDLVKLGKEILLIPVVIYFIKNMKFKEEADYLPTKKLDECIDLLKNITRYYFAKSFHKDLEGSTVEDEIYKMNAKIWEQGTYQQEKTWWIQRDFKDKLEGSLQAKYRRIFTTILMNLNFNKNDKYTSTKLQVEHILPKRWENNYYDKWDKKKVDSAMQTIGNLVLLEKTKNIKGSNKFFTEKKELYKNSNNVEARDLSELDEWNYEQYIDRHKKSVKQLKDFFAGSI